MAFVQQHRPQSARQVSYHAPEPAPEVATSSQHLKRPLDQSEEWVLFSPIAPSTTARTQTTSTERTPRTAGLSRFSDFGSQDTAARSEQDDDQGTCLGTEEELDSLDDGLHAFHEPSEYGAPAGRLQQSGDTVLPTHDGLGEFQPDATMQEHMWQFERPRRRTTRRRSSVQRHFNVLDDSDHVNTEQDRRQRIEQWRLEQSKALLEEIEKETRRRRRMSTVSNARSQVGTTSRATTINTPKTAPSVTSTQSDSSDEGTENLSFWQRITQRVIRDLIGLDENTLSVIFGETLPKEAMTSEPGSSTEFSANQVLQDAGINTSNLSDTWQTKLLERVAQELGTLVHQLSEHPGAFSTYQHSVANLDYAGLTNSVAASSTTAPSSTRPPTSARNSASSPASTQFAPTFPMQTSHTYSEASLWGIEEEPEPIDARDASNGNLPPPTIANIAEDLAREREYWERELDVKMIFNFLVKRFTSHRSGAAMPVPTSQTASTSTPAETSTSARRAAIIRQHHPLVSRTTPLPTSSSALSSSRENQPHNQPHNQPQIQNQTYRTYFSPPPLQNHAAIRHQKLRSNSSCASQSTKKSKRSARSAGNYWDFGGSVAGEV
ncbi:hypothetical protein T440DRAFT_397476 [Plenodomus tracheiphilus IPT5]|uniref:Uncharacterized protein n=1 Tax=Plenodomus tracheiphilus IPT5 TaxID=1408161 RepID=A0A6A7B3Y0_9PLEO|nr:hypothetical protein T440DRAFT_397476 [Plenodomus tracheiphilus IPT5]